MLKASSHGANSGKILVANTEIMAPTNDSHSPVRCIIDVGVRKIDTVKPNNSSIIQS